MPWCVDVCVQILWLYNSSLHRKRSGVNVIFYVFLKRNISKVYLFQNTIYLYSMTKHRIEFKIDLENEKFLAINFDGHGFFLETQSFKTPRKVYRIDFDQLKLRAPFVAFSIIKPLLWKESKLPNLNVKIKVLRDSFHSFDKTKVPITIIHKSNHANDTSKMPCLVFAYGGYGIPMLPLFKLFFLLFIELFNGVVGSYKKIYRK